MKFETTFVEENSDSYLHQLAEEEKIRSHKIAGVQTILLVLSGRAMLFDRDSLIQKITMTYPGAKIYFISTLGKAVGAAAPQQIDLVIDFTGPRQRHKWFLARSLRARAKFLVGRNAGFFRNYIYNRVHDEFKETISSDVLERERLAQKKVLELVGVPVAQRGLVSKDLGHEIASDLPPLRRI